MITQQEFVADCYLDYAARGLERGNPEHGTWNKCHYPFPKSLGGTEWIWLLEEHHAVQGLLQCLEFNHPCIYGWERKYLPDEMLPLYNEWISKKNKRAVTFGHTEEINQRRAEWNKTVLPLMISGENNYAWDCRWYHNSLGENKRFPEHPGGDWLPGMSKTLKFNTELRSNNAKHTNSSKVQCTVTGHISNPGGLSNYQKARGIDTSNRIRLE